MIHKAIMSLDFIQQCKYNLILLRQSCLRVRIERKLFKSVIIRMQKKGAVVHLNALMFEFISKNKI